MTFSRQEDEGQERNLSRLLETVNQLCGAVAALSAVNVQEQDRRRNAERVMEAAEQAKCVLENQRDEIYREKLILESRLADTDIPPVCGCGRVGYEIYCRCGKQLK